jgi:hypothetical protein
MGLLDAAARIVQLGGEPERAASVADMRSRFEERTGAFAPEDPWFEERSGAFWGDAVTRQGFGRQVEDVLTEEQRAWLGPLERAHRGLFRSEAGVLVDVWSGAELIVTMADDASRAELAAAEGQLFDGRVVAAIDPEPLAASAGLSAPMVVALLPGSVFHPQQAAPAIAPVLHAARERGLRTHDVLDALLRMARTLRSLSRVKAAYAYRLEALTLRPARPAEGARPSSPRG